MLWIYICLRYILIEKAKLDIQMIIIILSSYYNGDPLSSDFFHFFRFIRTYGRTLWICQELGSYKKNKCNYAWFPVGLMHIQYFGLILYGKDLYSYNCSTLLTLTQPDKPFRSEITLKRSNSALQLISCRWSDQMYRFSTGFTIWQTDKYQMVKRLMNLY